MKNQEIREKAQEFLNHQGYGKGTNYTTDVVTSLIVRFAEYLQSDVSVSDEGIDEHLVNCGFHINTKYPLNDIITDSCVLRMLVKETIKKYSR